MYKVFVKNVPIYFQKNSPSQSRLVKKFFPSLSLSDFDAFARQINTLNSEERTFINGPFPAQEIKSFFKHFQWIEAAGGIVKNTETNKSLFILRNGVWDIPKGEIEEGEKPEEAALREINEECGISELMIEHELSPTYHVYFAYGKYWIKKTYWFALTSTQINIEPQLEEDITEVKWFPENQIETVKKNTFRSILDVIEDYFKDIK